MGLRDLFGRYLPSWLADNFPASPSYGYRFLWVFHAFVDSEIDRMLQGSLAAVGRGTPTALKYIGQARVILRGRYDTDDQYLAKLRTWIDRHKERGNQRRLAREIWEYLGDDGSGASRVRVINRAGWWVTIETDGTLTETQATFDWDSISHPERNDPDLPWWSDLFIIVYPSWTFRAGTLGDLTGADGFALGHMAPIEQVDDLHVYFREWKGGHECVRCVIWTTDTTKFDPTVPASNPDGTWGAWGTTGSGSRVASGRDLTTCRFWEPGCIDREGGGPVFRPDARTDCIVWFDTRAGLTVVDGKVAIWRNRAPATTADHARDLAQATAAQRPAYSAEDDDFNGEASLDFTDASPADTWLATGAPWVGGNVDQPVTWYVVALRRTGGPVVFSGTPTLYAGSSSTEAQNGGDITAGAVSADEPHVFCVVATSTDLSLYVDDSVTPVASDTSEVGLAIEPPLLVGTFDPIAGEPQFDGKIAVVGAFSTVHDAATRKAIMGGLSDRYGIGA